MNLVLADLHVKQRTWANYSQLNGDAYAALRKIASRLPENKRDTAILCGDTFDTNRPSSTDVSEVLRFLSTFKRVLYIPGNHDSVEPSWLELLNRMGGTCLAVRLSDEPQYMPGSCIPVYGFSETYDREALLAFLRALPIEDKPAYVVLHTSFKHLLGHEEAWQLCGDDLVDIFGKKDVRILVGHVHTHDFRRFEGFGGYVYSPGSLFPCSWDKVNEPYVFSTLDSEGKCSWEDCAVRKYSTVRYTTTEALSEAAAQIVAESGEGMLPPMLRVAVPAGVQLTLQQNQYPGVILQCVPEQTVTTEGAAQATGARPGTTLQQAVMDELADDGLMRPLALALLSSDDPVSLVGEWIDFWNVERATHA